jgi:dipeptidyl aminopeptidase/acylaminoacyl peptidase
MTDAMDLTHRPIGSLFLSTLCCLSSVGCFAAPAEPPLEVYGKLPQLEQVRVSPSGKRVAMIGVANGKRQLVVAEVAGNKLLKAAGVGSNKIRDLAWAGNDHVLAFVTSTTPARWDYVGRYELGSVVHIGLDEKSPWSVFENADSIEHVVYGYVGSFLTEGRWSGYFAGVSLRQLRSGFGPRGYVRDHGYADLYRVDLETAQPTMVAEGAAGGDGWVIAPDGSVVAHAEYDGRTGAWNLYKGADPSSVLTKKMTPTEDIDLRGLGRTPGTVLVTDQSDDGDLAEEIDLSNGHVEHLLGDCNVEDFLFDPLSHLLIGATIVEEPGARLFDAALQRHFDSTRKAFPSLQMRLESFSPQLKEMVVFTAGNGDSGTYWFVNGATHRADPIGYPYPQIRDEKVASVSTIAFHAADGLAMEGVLTLPPGQDPKGLPLVVLPHGGPIGVHDSVGFNWWAQAFASRGYAVFQPNYRGSGGYSAEFRKAGYGEWGRKMLSDIADGVSELARRQIIDARRVCIVGGSYGGYAALAGVTMQHGLYRCAVSVAGISSMSTFIDYEAARNDSDGPVMQYWRKVTGSESEGALRLYDISPSKFASRADAPILLIHGKDDTRVPIAQSRMMAAALKEAGKPYVFVELPNEDHFLSRDETRLAMLQAAVNFVEKYNPAR